MYSETYDIRADARDEMRSPRNNGSLRSGCDLADKIRAHADPLQYIASLWDAIGTANLDAMHSLEKATKIIALGLRKDAVPVSVTATGMLNAR